MVKGKYSDEEESFGRKLMYCNLSIQDYYKPGNEAAHWRTLIWIAIQSGNIPSRLASSIAWIPVFTDSDDCFVRVLPNPISPGS